MVPAAALCQAQTTRPSTAAAGEGEALTNGIVKLADGEWKLWELTVSRPHRLWEDMLYIMLSKTAALPPVSDGKFQEFDRPAYASLLEDPTRYVRLPVRPIAMSVRVVRVYKLLPGGGGEMGFSEYWPREKPVWRIECLNAQAAAPAAQPLIVLSTVDPGALLPRPDQKHEGDGQPRIEYKGVGPSYAQLPLLELAGIFYKVHRTADEQGEQRDFPVVLAWHLMKKGSGAASPRIAQAAIIFLVIVAGAALFIFFKRRLKRLASMRQERSALHRRLRRGMEMTEEERSRTDEEEAEIDLELKAAVEQFRKQKEAGDGQDNKS
jgi:hypothetical protein